MGTCRGGRFLLGVSSAVGVTLLAACTGPQAPAASGGGTAPTTAPAAGSSARKTVLFWGRQQFLPESNDYLTESVKLAGDRRAASTSACSSSATTSTRRRKSWRWSPASCRTSPTPTRRRSGTRTATRWTCRRCTTRSARPAAAGSTWPTAPRRHRAASASRCR